MKKRPPLPKWEYLAESIPNNDLIPHLETRGADGWELVTVLADNDDRQVFMKRLLR